ncbi:CHRD domain-containing protein [Nonomuraea sp. NPDC047897]|uniref:CHRD domain-containing protein n=1 Tax=Nonomuraea sp. NPDC047897 TaxID=3364346 RepID=UPI00371F5ACB
MPLPRPAPTGVALAAGLLACALTPVAVPAASAASAAPAGSSGSSAGSPAGGTPRSVYLAAGLRGRNEVGAKGDADGRSTVVLRISGNRVTFAVRWNGIDLPSAGHVHLGARGVNGAVQLPFFTEAPPRTTLGVLGTVEADPALLRALVRDPSGFYANLHNARHPQGAVRGQFHRLARPVDLRGVLHGSNRATLAAHADGAQEVRGNDGMRRGDPDGRGVWWLRPHGSAIAYTALWEGIGRVTGGHVHQGGPGRNGPVVADLLGAPAKGLPAHLIGLAGEARVPAAVVRRIAAHPGRYYTNLHTTEFGGGAVRGRLAGGRLGHPRALTADVLRGRQVYACARQRGGGHAFTRPHGAAAELRRGVSLSLAPGGTPRWTAPDGSVVRGRPVAQPADGRGRLPVLLLAATAAGRDGLLSHTTQILRVNAEGGLPPAGACRPGTRALVPFRADYLFLG